MTDKLTQTGSQASQELSRSLCQKQIIINGINIFNTLDEWADLISQEWCSGEYPTAEIIKNYILDINKQLARKTQECEQIKEKYEALKLENQEGYEIVAELKHECEELKSESFTRESLISMQEKDIDRYRKALEEIEGIAKNFGSYAAWQEQRINKILDIINKAKNCE